MRRPRKFPMYGSQFTLDYCDVMICYIAVLSVSDFVIAILIFSCNTDLYPWHSQPFYIVPSKGSNDTLYILVRWNVINNN